MKVLISQNILLLILILILINGIVSAQPGNYYPPPSSISYQTDTLIIYPPDSLPGDPVILLGYNIYIDNDFFDNVMVLNPLDPVYFFLDDESLLPGSRIFCATAVYNEWISEESTCDTAFIAYGYELPFYEDWSSGSFETLHWTTDSDHWIINSDDGNPSPSISFVGEPGLTNYTVSCESYFMNAVGLFEGNIWLDFDIKFDEIQTTFNEMLSVQVWNSSNQGWTMVAEYWSWDGSFTWTQEHINIRSKAMNKVFKIRFVATGENSADISAWSIDNIHVYRHCDPPYEFEIEENLQFNKLTWIGNNWFNPFEWLHWDDGQNSGTSIGTGSAAEFDVAARWDSEQITYYNGYPLDEIYFFPAESQATYNVRVWTGSGPDTLVVDQPVLYPVIDEWNYVNLDNPVVVDSSKDLWIGYHISTPTGYPAGVDDGPAINGYGNMIFWDSTWSTLLEINPELDFNWNITGHIAADPYHFDETFYIYRDRNQEGFEYYDMTTEYEYVDSNIDLSDYYCYIVTEIWSVSGDTCESESTDTVCEVLMLGTGMKETESRIRVFPNPVQDFLHISSWEKIYEVLIYNVLGECVLNLEIGNSEGKVDVSGLENGIYFVEVVTGKLNFNDKILIFR